MLLILHWTPCYLLKCWAVQDVFWLKKPRCLLRMNMKLYQSFCVCVQCHFRVADVQRSQGDFSSITQRPDLQPFIATPCTGQQMSLVHGDQRWDLSECQQYSDQNRVLTVTPRCAHFLCCQVCCQLLLWWLRAAYHLKDFIEYLQWRQNAMSGGMYPIIPLVLTC